MNSMQISHASAQRWIQLDADQALSQQDKLNLQEHLKSCADCRHYANRLKEMEGILLPVMRRNWNLSPAPLSIDSLRAGKSKIQNRSYILATRTAIIGLVCMAFLFSIWQLTISSAGTPGLLTAAVPPIPTPSTQFTLTSKAQKNCGEQSYIVKENDTLEGIAVLFASSKDEIRAANQMLAATLRPGTTLWIPVCTLTPTSTLNALRTTYTPSIGPTTLTPGG
jgi:predicted anti-sigma-YlaC factor YlaD